MSIAITSTSGSGEDGGDVRQRSSVTERPSSRAPTHAPRQPSTPSTATGSLATGLTDSRSCASSSAATTPASSSRPICWRALAEAGHEPVDCGAFEYDAQDDYPPFCFAVGERTVAEPGSLGVVIGGSGNGEQIAANKVPGVRAALAWNTDTAQLARQHNDANVVVDRRPPALRRGGDRAGPALPGDDFSDDERHVRRIGLITDYERDRHRPAGGLPTRS